MAHLVILGNGVAGITTARHARKRSAMEITVISAESQHFYSRPALMYIFMGHMRYEHTKPYEDGFWAKNRINLVRGFVQRIDTDNKRLHLQDGRVVRYDQLVLATGSKSNKFGWPGQDLPGVQGLYSLQDLELLEQNLRGVAHAVLVGGGLIGVEFAEMLRSRKIPVTFLVRENQYWDNILPQEEATLISRHVRAHGIDLRLRTQLQEILPGENGRVRAVVTDSGEELACQFVGLTPGVQPNIDVVKTSKVATARGVLVNDYLATNIPDVYAAGDCAEIQAASPNERNRIEQLWYTGRLQALALAKTICGEATKYARGVWYNSAKFFDLEYQTYGYVHNTPRDGELAFYWEHSSGRQCLRIVFNAGNAAVVGCNAFGIRMRHEVWDCWIREQRTVDYALAHLCEANFDPEFFKKFEAEIVAAYNQHMPGKNLRLQRSA